MGKINKPQAIRGTQDIFGELQENFAHVVHIFDKLCGIYGFHGVKMPVIEQISVFARTLGESTDVVSKEMYAFEDRSGNNIALRPEFTAGIARAYLTNGWQQFIPLKVATHGPLFRYERPQKGRYRQFHQLDAEIIGAGEAQADIELLCFAHHLLNELGISDDIALELNTLGDPQSREAWRLALIEYFSDHQKDLSELSQERLKRNPLRILDSKSAQDKILVANAPQIDDYLSEEALAFFHEVSEGLDSCSIAWERAPRLVRGLDYYRHTAFEFVTTKLGAQATVLGGGRYDGLIETLGGPATPAVGWAAGIERLALLTMEKELAKSMTGPDAVIIPLSKEAQQASLTLLNRLRRSGVNCDMEMRGNMKKRMQRANNKKAQYAIIIGEDELSRNEAVLKSFTNGEQESLTLDIIVHKLSS